MKKMTRVCTTIPQPSSPRAKAYSVGSQQVRLTHEGGVSKRQASVPAKSCFKAMTKSNSKADCFAQLKNLLPNASQSKSTTELALVEESIAYIAYLESLLRTNCQEDQSVTMAIDLLKTMKF